MLSITWNGRSLKAWWTQKLREAFVRQEVKPGRIMICWMDVDQMVYGWNMSADEEIGLGIVAGMIAKTKHDKLVKTINA